LKDLVPLTAIGSAYVWRAGPASSDCPQLRMRLVWFGGTCFRIRRSKQWSRAKLCGSASCRDYNGTGRGQQGRAKSIRLRTRLVSLNWLLLCAKEGRCEIPPRGCSLDLDQRACRSLIRACPWMVFKLEQLLERPGCCPGGTNSLASSHLQAGVIYL